MCFEYFVASRYLREKRKQAFIDVVTAISIVGVGAGVASLIVALAINNGFRQDLQERVINNQTYCLRLHGRAGLKNRCVGR